MAISLIESPELWAATFAPVEFVFDYTPEYDVLIAGSFSAFTTVGTSNGKLKLLCGATAPNDVITPGRDFMFVPTGYGYTEGYYRVIDKLLGSDLPTGIQKYVVLDVAYNAGDGGTMASAAAGSEFVELLKPLFELWVGFPTGHDYNVDFPLEFKTKVPVFVPDILVGATPYRFTVDVSTYLQYYIPLPTAVMFKTVVGASPAFSAQSYSLKFAMEGDTPEGDDFWAWNGAFKRQVDSNPYHATSPRRILTTMSRIYRFLGYQTFISYLQAEVLPETTTPSNLYGQQVLSILPDDVDDYTEYDLGESFVVMPIEWQDCTSYINPMQIFWLSPVGSIEGYVFNGHKPTGGYEVPDGNAFVASQGLTYMTRNDVYEWNTISMELPEYTVKDLAQLKYALQAWLYVGGAIIEEAYVPIILDSESFETGRVFGNSKLTRFSFRFRYAQPLAIQTL